jgi:hypothetical protein
VQGRPDDLTVARLILTRQRQAGIDFDQAWQRMLGAIPEPVRNGKVRSNDRDITIAALHATEDEWARAFRYEPPAPKPQRKPDPFFTR